MTGEKNESSPTTTEQGFIASIANIAKKINSKKILKSELPPTIGNFRNDNTNSRQLSISKLNPEEIDNKLALLQFVFQKLLQAFYYKSKDQEKKYFAIPISDHPADEEGLKCIQENYEAFLKILDTIEKVKNNETETAAPDIKLVIAALKDVS